MEEEEVPAARSRALNLLGIRTKLEAHMKKAVENQAKYYNEKHTPRHYKVGDKVYLNSKNIKSTRPNKKLDYKFYSPYEVEMPICKQAYRLRLPKVMKIYDVFHVLLLEPYNKGVGGEPVPLSIIVNGKEEFKVEEVLDSRLHYKKLQYLVMWLDYLTSDNQWLLAVELDSAPELVDLFHELYPNKLGQKTGVKRRT